MASQASVFILCVWLDPPFPCNLLCLMAFCTNKLTFTHCLRARAEFKSLSAAAFVYSSDAVSGTFLSAVVCHTILTLSGVCMYTSKHLL